MSFEDFLKTLLQDVEDEELRKQLKQAALKIKQDKEQQEERELEEKARLRLAELYAQVDDNIKRKKLQKKLKQEQQEKNIIAIANVLAGQKSFPSYSAWDYGVGQFCSSVKLILQKISRMQLEGRSPYLDEKETSLFKSYNDLLAESGTKNPDDLENWMRSQYRRLRERYFRGVLKDSGSFLYFYTNYF